METDVERMSPKKSPPASMVEEHDSEGMQDADPVPDQQNIHVPTAAADAGRPTGPTPPGQCKFDGTDYPDWLPINPFKKADEPFTFPFPEVKGDPWANAAQMVKDFDDGMCTAWVDEIQNILIFSGLFSAIVTAFAVQTQNMLQPDAAAASVLLLAHLSGQLGNSSSPISAIAAPFQNESNPIQSIRINALIYFSLVLSLGTALFGILALQWIRSYRQYDPQTYKDRIDIRHIRYESLLDWKVPQIISALPLILQASLVIFFAGLADFLQSLNTTVAIIISSLIGTIVLFVVFTMIAPGLSIVKISFKIRSYKLHTFQTLCPYQSPQSWLVVQLVLFLQGIFHRIFPRDRRGIWNSWEVRDMAQAHNWPQLAKARPRYIDRGSAKRNSWDTTTLGWMLKNFTQDVEAFCSLFHCFQTLHRFEMRDTMLQVYHGRTEDIDTLININKSANNNMIRPLEAGHIYSKYLVAWAVRHEYWSHPGITIYATELILRSATYAFPPDSSDTPCRLVPSRLWEWYDIVTLPGYLQRNASSLASHSRMLTFAALVSRPALNILKSLRYQDTIQVRNWMFILTQKKLPFHAEHRDPHVVDDILMAMASRLETWLTTNPDEDITFVPPFGEPNMFSQLVNAMWLYSKKCDIVLMHRPLMKILLDQLANHPKGQRLWAGYRLTQDQDLHSFMDYPEFWQQISNHFSLSRAWWDKMLVDAFLDHKCATLIYDQERVDRLVKERDNAAILHGPVTLLDPDTGGHQQDTVLEADKPNLMIHISPPVSLNLPETSTSALVSPNASSTLAQYSSDAYPSIQPQPPFIEIVVDSV